MEDMQTNREIRDIGTRRCNLIEKCSTSWDPRHKMCFINVKSHLFMETIRKEVKPSVIWITQRCQVHMIMWILLDSLDCPPVIGGTQRKEVVGGKQREW